MRSIRSVTRFFLRANVDTHKLREIACGVSGLSRLRLELHQLGATIPVDIFPSQDVRLPSNPG